MATITVFSSISFFQPHFIHENSFNTCSNKPYHCLVGQIFASRVFIADLKSFREVMYTLHRGGTLQLIGWNTGKACVLDDMVWR